MKAIGIVRLTKDGERQPGNGPLRCRVAWDHYDKSASNNKAPDFCDVNVWGKSADALAPYMLKGTQVQVCGDLKSHEHEGKTYWSIDADGFGGVTLLGKSGGEAKAAPAPASYDTDDIPFP